MASNPAASAGGTKSVPSTYALDTRRSGSVVSESSTSPAAAGPYRDSFEDDEENQPETPHQYAPERHRPGVLGRLLEAVGMRKRGHSTAEYDYFATPRDQLPDGLLKKGARSSKHSRRSSPRELRRCRRGHVGAAVRRIFILSPVAILVFFGAIHLLQVLVGRAGFFWDSGSYEDDFLPDWGKPGHEGEGLAKYPTDATRDVIPIPCHSHNDYWRRIPFYDAIHWGCTGVEADVWLFDEELYVGHNTASLTKNRTFTNLYVNPILEMLAKMNPTTDFANETSHGIFDADPDQTLVLLVDFKTAGKETFDHVYKQLSPLREKNYLSYYDGEKVNNRAVTVVGTGNCPFDLIQANSTHRDIFFDAPLDKMGDAATSKSANDKQHSPQGTGGAKGLTADSFNETNSYYASVSFLSSIGFVWRGQLSDKQLDLIRSQIKGAHARNLKVRYWDAPTWPRDLRNHLWRTFMREGADYLNVDDLRGAAVESWRARIHGFW